MILLPGETAQVQGDAVFDGNCDKVIKALRNNVHTGYFLIENDRSKGLVLFDNGVVISAFHVNGNGTKNTAVKALMDFDSIAERDCRIRVSEVPLESLHLVKIVYLGNPLITDTEIRILDLKRLFKTYRNTITTGLIVIYNSDYTGFITINKGYWKIITEKKGFRKCFYSDDCRLSLFDMPDISLFDDIYQKKQIDTYFDIGQMIKEIVIKNLEDTFGETAISAVNVIDSWQFTLDNYDRKINELGKHINLFISTKKANSFASEQKHEIQQLTKRIIQ